MKPSKKTDLFLTLLILFSYLIIIGQGVVVVELIKSLAN